MLEDTPEMETLANTALEDLRITGQHAALPRWLTEPAPHSMTALARLDMEVEAIFLDITTLLSQQ